MIDYENIGVVGQDVIALDNDYTIRRTAMERFNRTTRLYELIQDAPNTVGWISLTRGGAAIHATLSTAMLFGANGDVDGQLEGQNVLTHLATHLGKIVFDVVRVTTGGTSDYLDSKEVLVVATAVPREA